MTRKIKFQTPKGESTLELLANGSAAIRNGQTSVIENDLAYLVAHLLDRVEALETKTCGTCDPTPTAAPVAEVAEPAPDSTVLVNAININTATQTDLESLQGIGRATAKAIIKNRPYADLADLKQKLELSDVVMDGIKESATV